MDARHWHKLVALAGEEIAATVEGLPAELRTGAEAVPTVLEPWLSAELAATGLEPDLLGLFVGDAHDISASLEPMPPQIFLFLESIWQFVEGEEEAFREEVRVTLLHELGHYLGFDEGDLELRGLD